MGSAVTVPASGETVSDERKLANFQTINLSGSLDVLVRCAAERSATIEADKNFLPHIKTDVSNGVLQVLVEKGYSFQSSAAKNIFITVFTPSLAGVNVNGAGDLRLLDYCEETVKQFRAAVNGSGDLHLHVRADSVAVQINGSGNVHLESDGAAADATYVIRGSGDINAFALEAAQVKANISGSGNIRMMATKHASITIHGSGNVELKGGAESSSTIRGSGRVKILKAEGEEDEGKAEATKGKVEQAEQTGEKERQPEEKKRKEQLEEKEKQPETKEKQTQQSEKPQVEPPIDVEQHEGTELPQVEPPVQVDEKASENEPTTQQAGESKPAFD